MPSSLHSLKNTPILAEQVCVLHDANVLRARMAQARVVHISCTTDLLGNMNLEIFLLIDCAVIPAAREKSKTDITFKSAVKPCCSTPRSKREVQN